jgi:3-hydroxy-9,10-secoandrosta-1,3,5(10)-triene-9,17-dione monooxygenase reductase component
VSDDVIAIDSAEFRKVLGHFPTGVTVVAAVADGKPAGLAVGSFFSVSLDPPLVGFCVGKASSSWATHQGTPATSWSTCSSDSQGPLSGQFSSKMPDKFEGLDWTPAVATGGPRLDGCLAHIDCTLESIYDGGDHDIVIGRVQGSASTATRTARCCSSRAATASSPRLD